MNYKIEVVMVTLNLDDEQAKCLIRLLGKETLNPTEWRELIGLREVLADAVGAL